MYSSTTAKSRLVNACAVIHAFLIFWFFSIKRKEHNKAAPAAKPKPITRTNKNFNNTPACTTKKVKKTHLRNSKPKTPYK